MPDRNFKMAICQIDDIYWYKNFKTFSNFYLLHYPPSKL